jgi:AraC family transcriptional regulator
MRPLSPFQRTALRDIQSKLSEPLLFLSSEQFDWPDVLVNVFHEPLALSGWQSPATPEVSLVLMARGNMLLEYKTADNSWKGRVFRQGHLFLKPAGVQTSELRWHSISDEPMQTVHVRLKTDVFSQIGNPGHHHITHRTGFYDPLLSQVILALWHELEEPSQTGIHYAQSATQLLAAHLSRNYTETTKPPEQGPLSQAQIQHLTLYIQTHIHQKLPLAKLARQVDFSPHYFARLFRQTTGESPHQFVLRQRISHAKYLLNKTNLSVARVAIECGFANPGHLTRTFKHHVGLTPSDYRSWD